MAKKLNIKIVEGVESMIGKEIIINAQGLEVKGLNTRKDGCSVIGSKLLKNLWNLEDGHDTSNLDNFN